MFGSPTIDAGLAGVLGLLVGSFLNVVMDVYPTKQQTGGELFQEVHVAAQAFPRVALYFENSILPPDLPLLASAAAVVTKAERRGTGYMLDSPNGVGLNMAGPVTVNGAPWPVWDGNTVWLPPGPVEVAPAASAPAVQVLDFNGDLKGATVNGNIIELGYESAARALVTLNRPVKRLEVDGSIEKQAVWAVPGRYILQLPKGQHLILIEVE